MQPNFITITGGNGKLAFYFNTKDASFKQLSEELENKLSLNQKDYQQIPCVIKFDGAINDAELSVIDYIFTAHGLVRDSVVVANNQEIGADGCEIITYSPAVGNSILLTVSVRSGQHVKIRGNAIILGDLNAGGIVEATGHIIIMGNCRGIVHAGSLGATDAYVVALKMSPVQIRIADQIALFAEERYVDGAEIAQMDHGQIILLPYATYLIPPVFDDVVTIN